jgi:multisubunit Na+/H+ antiporter MnhB subunit
MRIAMLLIAISQTMLAATFGVEWVRDQRRPPHLRNFGRHRKVFIVVAGGLAVASLTMAFLLGD